jgi:hypothetical protein
MHVSDLINCGVYVFSAKVFNLEAYQELGRKYG